MEHEPIIGQQVNVNDNFLNEDIILDCDNLPWQYYDGRWSSSYSARMHEFVANEFGDPIDVIRIDGLTTRQLMVTKIGYGPFKLIWRAP